MIFDFNNIKFTDITGNELSSSEFKIIFGSEKEKLVANLIWREAPTIEIDAVAKSILNKQTIEVDNDTLDLLNEMVTKMFTMPIKMPILSYIKNLKNGIRTRES